MNESILIQMIWLLSMASCFGYLIQEITGTQQPAKIRMNPRYRYPRPGKTYEKHLPKYIELDFSGRDL